MTLTNIKDKNIIITAGGTGGHIFPALAVAEALQNNGANVTWVGTKDSMEDRLVSGKFPIEYIKSSGIRGKGIIKKLTMPIQLLSSVLAARKIIKKLKADLVIGFGGYVSGPTCLAAKTKKVPVVVHEQNAKMGLTNRTIAKFAKDVCLAFPVDNISSLFSKKSLGKFHIVGNPIRQEILNLNSQEKAFSENGLNLLVLGGSQGSRAINTIIPELIEKANSENIDLNVWHQTGKGNQASVLKSYQQYGLSEEQIKVTEFIEDMAEAYRWADVVICRAGALTVSELAMAAKPAIFIPLPHAVDDHQTKNATYLVAKGAAKLIPQKDFNGTSLAQMLNSLFISDKVLQSMAKAAHNAAHADATVKVAQTCAQLVQKRVN